MNITELEEPSGRRIVMLVLSERNLLGLLAKVYDPLSHRTLERFSDDGSMKFVVKAEPNAEHYIGRAPGPMHPRTERVMKEETYVSGRRNDAGDPERDGSNG